MYIQVFLFRPRKNIHVSNLFSSFRVGRYVFFNGVIYYENLNKACTIKYHVTPFKIIIKLQK